jgi:virulence-associated protein VagC
MKGRVGEQGLFIPKELLEGFDEVEIRRENHALLIVPLADGDPILQLGQEPVTCELDDASIDHDRYLYGA